MNPVNDAFEHGAGFSTTEFAQMVAIIGMILTTAWVLWVGWSVFRGLKNLKTDKVKLNSAMLRAMFIWLIINYILFTGVFTVNT